MSEALIFAFRIAAIAMTVVFSSLLLVSFVISLFKNMNKVSTAPAPSSNLKEEGKKVEEKYPEDLPPELLAVISTAIAVVLDKKFHIKTLRYRSTVPESSWNKQGVASIMASHAINKHKSEYHRS